MSAAARAAHLLVDDTPTIFADTMAHTLLGLQADELLAYHRQFGAHPALSGARTTATVRSRYTEDRLARLADRGIDQYVILGAGLDSFAYRSPLAPAMRVFEVDEPGTQRWKRKLLAETAITVPPSVCFVPLDLEIDSARSLLAGLAHAGFDPRRPALVSCLGVTMYLTSAAIEHVLAVLSGFAPGTEIIAEHLLPAEHRDAAGHTYAELVMAAAAEQGEPWKTLLGVERIEALLNAHGIEPVEHLRLRDAVDPENWDRTDGLHPFELSILTRAIVPARG